MIQIGANADFQNLGLSAPPWFVGGIVSITKNSLSLRESEISSPLGSDLPLVHQTGGIIRFSDVKIEGKPRSAPLIVSEGGTLELSSCVIQGSDVQGDATLILFDGTERAEVVDCQITPGNGKKTAAIVARETSLVVRRSGIGTGVGRTRSAGIQLYYSDAVVDESMIWADPGAWIATCIEAEFSRIEISESTLEAAGNRGAMAIFGSGTSFQVSGNLIRSQPTREFLFLFQLQESEGLFTNNMLTGNRSIDYIGIDLTSSRTRWIGNTMVHGSGNEVSTGVRMAETPQTLLVNNILAISQDEEGLYSSTKALVVSDEDSRFTILNNNFDGWDEVFVSPFATALSPQGTNDLNIQSIGGNIGEGIDRSFRTSSSNIYLLSPDSECIDAGFDLSLLGEDLRRDYEGEVRPVAIVGPSRAYDIGADEYQSR